MTDEPVPPPVWALHTEVDTDTVNLHLARLETVGLLGISEVDGRATVYLSRRDDSLPLPGRWEALPERDWNAEWRRSIAPVTVGAITVVPPWLATGAPEELVVEPAQAFGTGHHETTTGCLAALQELDLRGCAVLDVGSGTGVLAIAAARLGAQRVVAVDVDPLAVAATADNAARNGVAVTVREGSLDAAGDGPYDVVVANLDTATLTRLADALAAVTGPGGALVASGVSNPRRAEAETALRRAGFAITGREGAEWTLLTGRRGR